jgi:hypothetical protein
MRFLVAGSIFMDPNKGTGSGIGDVERMSTAGFVADVAVAGRLAEADVFGESFELEAEFEVGFCLRKGFLLLTLVPLTKGRARRGAFPVCGGAGRAARGS